MPEPIWVREEVVQAIHGRQLAEHGGEPGIRDAGLLSSALARPRNLVAYADQEPDLAALAAAYAFGVANNHPFLDGNKRTAYVVCRTFLKLNDCDLEASPEEKYLTFMKLAKGELAEEALVRWIRAHLRPR